MRRALTTRPVPGCMYTRLPGDGLVVTRYPASFRGNTAAPEGKKEKPCPESNVTPEVFLLCCSPLDVVTERILETE